MTSSSQENNIDNETNDNNVDDEHTNVSMVEDEILVEKYEKRLDPSHPSYNFISKKDKKEKGIEKKNRLCPSISFNEKYFENFKKISEKPKDNQDLRIDLSKPSTMESIAYLTSPIGKDKKNPNIVVSVKPATPIYSKINDVFRSQSSTNLCFEGQSNFKEIKINSEVSPDLPKRSILKNTVCSRQRNILTSSRSFTSNINNYESVIAPSIRYKQRHRHLNTNNDNHISRSRIISNLTKSDETFPSSTDCSVATGAMISYSTANTIMCGETFIPIPTKSDLKTIRSYNATASSSASSQYEPLARSNRTGVCSSRQVFSDSANVTPADSSALQSDSNSSSDSPLFTSRRRLCVSDHSGSHRSYLLREKRNSLNAKDIRVEVYNSEDMDLDSVGRLDHRLTVLDR